MLFHNINNGSMAKHQLTSSNKSLAISTNDSNKKVKNLLLQGWRNRWSAAEFATYLKQQLSIVSVSGDNYELSKLVLQQATVGRQPVVLFIDYLHHLLSCRVVSFGSVINSIIETCKKENTLVVICMLDFLLGQEANIICLSGEQDCLNLAVSLARLLKFVFTCLEYSTQRLNDLISKDYGNKLSQHEQAIEKCANLLMMFKNNQLLISLIYVGLIEEHQSKSFKLINFTLLKDKLIPKMPNNKSLLNSLQNVIFFVTTLQKLNPNLQAKKYLKFQRNLFNYRKSPEPQSRESDQSTESDEPFFDQLETTNQALISLNCVVAFDVILNPKTSPMKLAHQLYDIAITNHLKLSFICSELIRNSLINFVDSLDHTNSIESEFLHQFQNDKSHACKPRKENMRWAMFVYIKLPLVLRSLKEILKTNGSNSTLELDKALEKLINNTPLLELVDYKTDCDCMANLLSKFCKMQLIDKEIEQSLLRKKTEKMNYFNNLNGMVDSKTAFKKENENLVMLQGHILLDRAEPIAEGVFASLHPDKELDSKPDNAVQVFVRILTNNSIELVLNPLTYTGKLSEFVKRIIHFNELYNHATCDENSDQAAIRATLFDISFLILYYIVYEHGQEIVLDCLEEEGVDLSNATNGNDDMEIEDKEPGESMNPIANSFFVKFCIDFMPENLKKLNYDEKLSKHIDANKVEGLLNLFSTDNFDYQHIKWDEVLFNVLGVFKELLQAHLNDHLSFEELTSIYLLNMIKRNCSIGLIIASYAVNRMNNANSKHKEKILAILNYITNSNHFSAFYKTQTETSYKEKHKQAIKMIRNLMNENVSKTACEQQKQASIGQENKLVNQSPLTNVNSTQIELYKVLKYSFLNTIKKGWLTTSSVYCFDRVLRTAGATWFMDKLIHLLLYECDTENLFEGVELVYGLSTLDLEQCCLALLNVVIPQYLVSDHDQQILIEPKLIALSRLLSTIIYSVLELSATQRSSSNKLDSMQSDRSSIRRTSSYYIEDNFVQYEDKLLQSASSSANNDSEDAFQNVSNQYSNKSSSCVNSIKRKEVLFNSVARLFKLVSSLMDRQKISQRTIFSLIFLEQLVYTFPCAETQSELSNTNAPVINDLDKLVSNGLSNDVQIILKNLPFDIVLNLVRVFPNKINFDLILSISNLQSTYSRRLTAKSLCELSKSKKLSNFLL